MTILDRVLLTALPLAMLALSMAVPADTAALEETAGIRQSARSFTLSTRDGLALTVNRANGWFGSLSIGGSSPLIAPRPMIRFEEVLEVQDAPDLLTDGFGSGWSKFSSTGRNTRTVILNQTEPTPLILSGWCRYETSGETAGWMNRSLALNAYGTYTDGETMPEQSAYFGQYNHGPQFNSRVICPDKPLKQLEVKQTADEPKASAWFKGITLKQAKYQVTSPGDPCRQIDSTLTQEFSIGEAAIRGVVKYQAADECIIVRCRFQSERKSDRAISGYFAIPFDATGGTWHDDLRNSRKIEPGKIYRRDDYWYGAGRDGYNDRYPLACVENKNGHGLAIATDLSEPRVFRTDYDASRRELRIRYDLGLSPDGGRWANQASFTVYLFTYEGRDGMRGAADKFMRVFDWAFEKRAKQDGMWIPFVSPEAIPGGHEDFRLSFVETITNPGWERVRGMYTLRYVQPYIHHQDFVPELVAKAVSGTPDPSVSVKLADQLSKSRPPDLFEDDAIRFAAYRGSYITDNWGQPQGYFFRQPNHKENMMIVSPNPDLPAPEGSDYSSGGYDLHSLLEAADSPSHWHIDSWTVTKVTEAQIAASDSNHKTDGSRSVRIDPVGTKSRWGSWTRGISQVFYYKGSSAGPFTLSYSVRGENVPAEGTTVGWKLTFHYEDGSTDIRRVALDGVGPVWKRMEQSLEVKAKPYAVTVYFGKDSRSIDPSTIWLDDAKLTAQGDPENLLTNGSFESAEVLPGGLSGVYLDTLECYANNLNYRREHWLYAEEPLTFDSARKPALQQQFSHVTFSRRVGEWARARNKVVFGNCAPVTPFAAPYMDAMGSEEFWAPDGKWNPKSDREFQFVRFMSGAKSWSILQYSDLTPDQVRAYVNRCAFYGVYPSWIYKWTNPVFIAQIRPLYAKMMPILVEINKAGWQPLTLASSSNPDVWIERFGAGDTVYLTLFNPTDKPQPAVVTLDNRLGVSAKDPAVDMTTGAEMPSDNITVDLQPEDIKIIRLHARP